MPAHLRPLARCRTCQRPATVELYNAVNAPQGVYYAPHGQAALRAFEARNR